MNAAVVRDSVALRLAFVNDSTISRLNEWKKRSPELFQVLADSMKPERLWQTTADSAYGLFRFSYLAKVERVAMGFSRVGNEWRIWTVGLVYEQRDVRD